MIKKALLAAAVILLGLSSCHKEPVDKLPGADSLVGNWELVSVETKSATVGSINVEVFITFTAPDSFTLYQKLGEGRFTKFTGTYSVEEAKLSGVYSNNNKKWGPYTLGLEEDTLKLTTEGGEVNTYKKIGEIPGNVTSNLY